MSRMITSTAITRFRTPPRISRLLRQALLRNERQSEHDQEYHHQNSDYQVESPTQRLAPSHSVATWPQLYPLGPRRNRKGYGMTPRTDVVVLTGPEIRERAKGKDSKAGSLEPNTRASLPLTRPGPPRNPVMPGLLCSPGLLRTTRHGNEKAAPRKERRPVETLHATSLHHAAHAAWHRGRLLLRLGHHDVRGDYEAPDGGRVLQR
jgi:hypothetical protein